VAIHPDHGTNYLYQQKSFKQLELTNQETPETSKILEILEENDDNLPVYLIKENHDITA
jgi:hypothetical protein